jgi:hypothetical protein
VENKFNRRFPGVAKSPPLALGISEPSASDMQASAYPALGDAGEAGGVLVEGDKEPLRMRRPVETGKLLPTISIARYLQFHDDNYFIVNTCIRLSVRPGICLTRPHRNGKQQSPL